MAVLRTEALILRVVDFGESDRIVHLLVPDSGRLPAIAKGARRSLDEAALRVADAFTFAPARNRNEIVPVWILLPITFQVR